jgi:hypothetical protein
MIYIALRIIYNIQQLNRPNYESQKDHTIFTVHFGIN